MYEKFYNNSTNSNSIINYATHAFESRETFNESEIAKYLYLDTFLNNKSAISLEADDDPFGDIGEDTGGFGDDMSSDSGDPFAADAGGDDGSDPFGDIGDVSDTGGGDDPFGGDSGGFDFDSASDDGEDIFGGGDEQSEEERQKAKQKAMLLDRAKSIKEDYDISRQIRANFPKKFIQLKQTLIVNINTAERTVLDKPDYEEVLRGIVVEYERMIDLVEAYIEVMAKKTYEDIFATYVSIHTSMIRLKNLYIKICGGDKKDIELEESKYSEII